MSLESCKTIYVAPSGPNCSLLPPVVIKLNQTHYNTRESKSFNNNDQKFLATHAALRYEAVAVSQGDGQGCPPEDVLNAIMANISQDIRELLQNNILPGL